MAKVVCIGSATKDIFFPTTDGVILSTPQDLQSKVKIAFELGAKYQIEEIYETLGGCAVNVAAGLAKIGHDAHCYCALGNDALSEWIESELERAGVGGALIRKLSTGKGDFSFIFVEKLSGERTIFTYHGCSKKFKFSSEAVVDADWVFIGDLGGDWQRTLVKIIDAAHGKEIKIAFNPRQQMIHMDAASVAQAIRASDVLFVNKDEAIEIISAVQGAFPEIDSEKFLLQKLCAMGAKMVVLTDGLRGAWCHDGTHIIHAKALEKDALDTTGSGDAFASGFFGALLYGLDMQHLLRWGIANSSSSVMHYGGQKGLLSQQEVRRLGESVEISVLR